MSLFVASLLVGIATVIGTGLLAFGYMRVGCWYTIGLQGPASVYDVLTGQYGFLLISLGTIVVCARALKRRDNSD